MLEICKFKDFLNYCISYMNKNYTVYQHFINNVILRKSTTISSITRRSQIPSEAEKAEAIECLKAAKKYKTAGQFSKAKKVLQHAFSLDVDNVDVLLALGDVLEQCLTSENLGSESLEFDKYPISVYGRFKLHGPTDALVLAAEHMYTQALIVNPLITEAQVRRRRLTPLVEEIDSRLFNTIDFKVRKFYHIPESNPGLRKVKMEHYFHHIYHSNAIEGNTLTLAQTRSILETRLAVGGKSLLEQNEVLGLDSAMRYINSTLLRKEFTAISFENILELHRRLLSFVDLSEAGHLRHTQVFVGNHQPPSWESISSLMHDLVSWINSDDAVDLHPIELAALTHWKLVFIHPFYDGNGRTARLLMNFILMRAGIPPAIIKLEDRAMYYQTIITANEGDVRPFIRFIASCSERTIDEYLDASIDPTGKVTRIEVDDSENVTEFPTTNPESTESHVYYGEFQKTVKSTPLSYNYLISPLEAKEKTSPPNVIYLGA